MENDCKLSQNRIQTKLQPLFQLNEAKWLGQNDVSRKLEPSLYQNNTTSATRVTELLRRQYRIKNILLQLWAKKHSIIFQPYVAAESYTILILVGSNLGHHQFLLPPDSRCNPLFMWLWLSFLGTSFSNQGVVSTLTIFPVTGSVVYTADMRVVLCVMWSLTEVKKMEIINHHTKKSSLGHLREVVVYQRFKLKRFDWENFGVLNRGCTWWCSTVIHFHQINLMNRLDFFISLLT